MECECLDHVEADDRRTPRRGRHDGELAEVLPLAEHPEQRRVSQRSRDAHRDMTLRDQVERVTGIALVEHDLAPDETSASGHRQHLAPLRFGQRAQQAPLHLGSLAASDRA